MFTFFIRFLVIFFAVILQMSLFSGGQWHFHSPSILLVVALAWTMIGGFTRASGWVVLEGVIADIFLFQSVGVSVILLIGIAYLASFFSKRYMVEHGAWGICFLIGFLLFATILHGIGYMFLQGDITSLLDQMSFALLQEVFWVFVGNAVLLWIAYVILRRIEAFLSFYEKRVQPKKYA